MPIPPIKQPEVRVNDRIRVPQVRVIGDDGSQIGVLPVREALAMAQSKALDLVEVSPTARPPVCRIMDYGKFKYEQNRRNRKAKKKQHQMQLKEIKLRPKIEGHDYGFKVQHARDFLTSRDKVKITVTFRGREMAHQDIGHRLIQKVIADLADVSTVESSPRSEGRTLNAVLMPKPPKPGGKSEHRESAGSSGAKSPAPKSGAKSPAPKSGAKPSASQPGADSPAPQPGAQAQAGSKE
ncbi:MAG: translation initiation factor IF-3 [Candidatus Eisenbacteria bacterium RBG_16_71_46]|nr:MAG: translation initiation factor IF-3 [Candidatus Eisenbacteria bacterium RBG_16_71_46]